MRMLQCSWLILLLVASTANAGRMPNEIDHVESVGHGLVKLYSADVDSQGEYHIIQTADVKRLVGGGKHKDCYMFYFTGVELVKLPIKNKDCQLVLNELLKSFE